MAGSLFEGEIGGRNQSQSIQEFQRRGDKRRGDERRENQEADG